MASQTGILINIKAWLPIGRSIDEQYEALTVVKTAHETGDYSALLTKATVEEVKTEQKTRRNIETATEAAPSADQPALDLAPAITTPPTVADTDTLAEEDEDPIPEFMRDNKKLKRKLAVDEDAPSF